MHGIGSMTQENLPLGRTDAGTTGMDLAFLRAFILSLED